MKNIVMNVFKSILLWLYDMLKATYRAAVFGFCFGLIFWSLSFGIWGCLLEMHNYDPVQLQLSAVIK